MQFQRREPNITYEAIGLSYVITTICLTAGGYWYYRSKKCAQEIEDLADQEQAYEVSQLHEVKKIHGKRYNLISGMLVRDEGMSDASIEKQRKALYKRLGKSNEDSKKLLTMETTQTVQVTGTDEMFRNRLNGEMLTDIKHNCILFDERNPLDSKVKTVLNVGKHSVKPLEVEVFNIRHKRKLELILDQQLESQSFSKIKYAAMEGASVSILGLMKYNAEKDQFSMTELSGVLSGGIGEARRQISERLEKCHEMMWQGIIFGVAGLGISFFLHFMRCQIDKRKKKIAEKKSIEAAGGKGSSECFICMNQIATVVMVPCNHMLACQTCTDTHKKQANNNCPICQREVDFSRSFNFLKAK